MLQIALCDDETTCQQIMQDIRKQYIPASNEPSDCLQRGFGFVDNC